MPLDHSTSSVSSPVGPGRGNPFTLILVILVAEFVTLLAFQNALRSASFGTVSIRMPMVWPLPVAFSVSALYAFSICATWYGGALEALLAGPRRRELRSAVVARERPLAGAAPAA